MLLSFSYSYIKDDVNYIFEKENLFSNIILEIKYLTYNDYLKFLVLIFLGISSYFNFISLNMNLSLILNYSIIHLLLGVLTHEIIWQAYIFKNILIYFDYKISVFLTSILYAISYSLFFNVDKLYFFSSINDFIFSPLLFSFYFILRIFLCIYYAKQCNLYFSILFHYIAYSIFIIMLIISNFLKFNLK